MPHRTDAMSADASLARFARARIAQELGGGAAVPPSDPGFREHGACFVTIHRSDGRLQGCVGSLEPRRPLLDDVAHNALAAAFHDPRADVIALDDVPGLDLAISLLSPLERVDAPDEDAARAALQPAVDGVVLRWQGRRATLLPQVWAQLPDPADFLLALKQKLGLPDDFWSGEVEVLRYTVRTVRDRGPRGRASPR